MKDILPAIRPLDTIPVEEDGRPYIVLRDPAGYSEETLAIALEVMPVLALFDGRHTVQQVVEQIQQATGEEISPDSLRDFAARLDEAYFLNTSRFELYRKDVEEEFKRSTVREPALAGNAYPRDRESLGHMLAHWLDAPPPDDFEPETPPEGENACGLLVPHIDYARGGATYGRAYRCLKDNLPDPGEGPLLAAVLGVAHAGVLEPVVVADKDFLTPFGTVQCDRSAVEILRKRLGETPFREQFAHRREHSIELQANWLGYLFGDRELRFLPVIVGGFSEGEGDTPRGNAALEDAIAALREVEENHPGPVLWIASVDLAHIGPRFGGEEPVNDSMCLSIEEKDMGVLADLRTADADGWWRSITADGNARQVCGLYATYLALRLLEGTKGTVLDYQQALSRTRDQMVTFAAALFTRP